MRVAWVSAKLMPARATSTTTSPVAGLGVGQLDVARSTSGPPNSSIWIAFIGGESRRAVLARLPSPHVADRRRIDRLRLASAPRSGSASACSAAPPSTSRSPRASSPRCASVGPGRRRLRRRASSRCCESRGIDTDDIERVAGGKTFFWRGHYDYDLNVAHTDDTQLDVFADFEPKLSRRLARRRHALPRQHPARPAAPGPRPVRRRPLRGARLDEPLDRHRQGLAAGGDRRGRLPDRQRRRDPPC